MDGSRDARLFLTVFLGVLAGCSGPAPVVTQQVTSSPVVAPAATSENSLGFGPGSKQFDVYVDPVHQIINVNPIGFSTKLAGIYVESRNAQWNAPTFSFDMIVWNNNSTMLNDVQSVVLSTTPGAPTINPVGNDGTTSDGKPYYSHGDIDTITAYPFDPVHPPSTLPWSTPYPPWAGVKRWQISDPAAVPFRFTFAIRSGASDLTATKNNPPVIMSVAPAANPITVGTATTLTATVADPNGDILTYGWRAPSGGTVTGAGNTAMFMAPGSPGTYPVEVTVDDGKGGVVTGQCDVAVSASGGDGVMQGLIQFGRPLRVPEEPASIDISFSGVGPVISAGDQPWIKVKAWNADHSREVPTTFTWTQSGSTPAYPMGNFAKVTPNTWITWLTRRYYTRSGSPELTVRAANGISRTFSLTINEEPPAVYHAYTHNNVAVGKRATAIVQRSQENRFYFLVGDPNGNMHLPPAVTVLPAGTSYTTALEGPNVNNWYQMVVTVPPNGFPSTGVGAASVGVQVSDDTTSDSHTMMINVQ